MTTQPPAVKKHLHAYKFHLDMTGVQIQVLDKLGKIIKIASGFITREGNRYALNTCWHVVTGYDPSDIKIGQQEPQPVALRINLQDAKAKPGMTIVGGKQSLTLPLYDREEMPRIPLWLQDAQHIIHADLNNVNLRVPFWHDAVQLLLPEDIRLSDFQVVDENDRATHMPMITDKVHIVGFPHGYSAAGSEQPTPIVLTRHIAATSVRGMATEILMDGPGTPGMSGGAVYTEFDNRLLLLGIYTGNVFPDYPESNIQCTTLGKFCSLALTFHALKPVAFDSPEVKGVDHGPMLPGSASMADLFQ